MFTRQWMTAYLEWITPRQKALPSCSDLQVRRQKSSNECQSTRHHHQVEQSGVSRAALLNNSQQHFHRTTKAANKKTSQRQRINQSFKVYLYSPISHILHLSQWTLEFVKNMNMTPSVLGPSHWTNSYWTPQLMGVNIEETLGRATEDWLTCNRCGM